MLNGPLTHPQASGTIGAMNARPEKKDFGAPYLRAWREKAGMTIQQLADKVGANDKSWVSKRENRRVPITVDDLNKIAKCYRIETSQLFFHPSTIFSDSLTAPSYHQGVEAGDITAWEEGKEMSPIDRAQLAIMILNLPPDVVPAVGLFIKRLLEAKEPVAHPHKGQAGA